MGVFELFEESWCVLQLQLFGTLPRKGCSCDEFDALQKKDINHGVPRDHMTADSLSALELSAIDSITRSDAQARYVARSGHCLAGRVPPSASGN